MHQPVVRRGYRITLLVPVVSYIDCQALHRAGEYGEYLRNQVLAELPTEAPAPVLHSVQYVDDIEGDANAMGRLVHGNRADRGTEEQG